MRSGAGSIVLIGGGEFSFGQTREFDDSILRQLSEGRRNGVFIPAASGSNEYGVHLAAYYRTIDPAFELTHLPIYRARDAKRGKHIHAIRDAGLIYLGGGAPNLLLEALMGSVALEAMRDALANGAVIAAIGAAASCCGAFAYDPKKAAAVPALGFFPGAGIQAGFAAEDDIALRRLMMQPEVLTGVGIPAGAGVVFGPDETGQVLGEGSIAVVRRAPLTS